MLLRLQAFFLLYGQTGNSILIAKEGNVSVKTGAVMGILPLLVLIPLWYFPASLMIKKNVDHSASLPLSLLILPLP